MVKSQAKFVALWKRILAYALDILLLSFFILAPLIEELSDIDSETFFASVASLSTSFDLRSLALLFVLGAFVFVYWSVLEFWFGQSVGKIILGIVVEGTKKQKISFLQALLRNVTKLSLLLLVLDTIYMFFTKKNQRYFEVLSDTHVVEEVRTYA